MGVIWDCYGHRKREVKISKNGHLCIATKWHKNTEQFSLGIVFCQVTPFIFTSKATTMERETKGNTLNMEAKTH